MALSTQASVIARRHALNDVRLFGFNSSIELAIKALYSELAQKKGNPDTQVVEVLQNGTSNVVLANAACHLYGLFLIGVAADSFQAADSATSAASPTIVIPMAITDQFALVFPNPQGHAYANGITCNGLNAGTNFKGIAIIGA